MKALQTRWLCWQHRRRPLSHVDASTVPVESCLQAPVIWPQKTPLLKPSLHLSAALLSLCDHTLSLSFPPPWAVQWFKLACGPRQCLLHNGPVGGERERMVGCSQLLTIFDCFHPLHYPNFDNVEFFSFMSNMIRFTHLFAKDMEEGFMLRQKQGRFRVCTHSWVLAITADYECVNSLFWALNTVAILNISVKRQEIDRLMHADVSDTSYLAFLKALGSRLQHARMSTIKVFFLFF